MLGSVTKLSCTQVLIIGIKSIQQPTQSHYTQQTHFFLFPLRFNVERDHPYVNLNSEKQYLRFATFEKVGGRSVDCWREFNSLQLNVSVVMFLQKKI